MLVTFKSKAAGDIYMFAEHAEQLLTIMGKSLDPPHAPRGIITPEQLGNALARLKAAADQARAKARENVDDETGGAPLAVSLAQRAYPLIDMLERSEKTQCEIVWGV